MDKSCHILLQLLIKECKEPSLYTKLEETWKKAHDEGRFHLHGRFLYHRTKHTCTITLKDRILINTILHECHDSIESGHISEDRTLESVKACSWWHNWRNVVAKYCQTCEKFQKSNRATSKKAVMMIQITEPKSPWERLHMDWVTALPQEGI
ncbi:hypothetical protein O181_036469 [Austropuccinia psidii MF-1]|uniref:Integrase zinc-binding domain-containing protein n=1 Tax=Austropuccinia psidii MF-1 TaxID=1389203 RepID=A0A9Q3D4Q6_9BASI|nr:hypothetical protein [Austropuccinia psidii MF-1]